MATRFQLEWRHLTGPVGRRLLPALALALAAAWTGWACLPPGRINAWSAPSTECSYYRSFLSRDGSTIVTPSTYPPRWIDNSGTEPGPVRLRDAATGRERVRILNDAARLTGSYLAPDNSWLLIRDGRGGLLLWDAATGRKRAELRPPDAGYVHYFVDSPPGSAFDGLPQDGDLAVTPDGRVIAGECCPGQAVALWDAATGRSLAVLDGACAPLVFTPDGRSLLTATPGPAAKLWDVASGRELLDLPGHASAVGAVAVSPDGRRLATGLHPPRGRQTAPTAVLLWDARTGQRLAQFDVTEQLQSTRSLGFSPDSRLLVIRSRSHRGLVWDVTADPPRNRDDLLALPELDHGYGGPRFDSQRLAFVPNGRGWWATEGRTVARADSSETPPRVVTWLSGDEPMPYFPVFAPDGRTFAIAVWYTVAAGSPEPAIVQRVRQWVGQFFGQSVARHDVHVFVEASGRELMTLPMIYSSSGYRVLGFTPDGRTFWTRRPVESGAGEWWVFEQWSLEPPGAPWLLLAVTALGALFAAADWRRERRRRAAIIGA
jgi:hypothetical protein